MVEVECLFLPFPLPPVSVLFDVLIHNYRSNNYVYATMPQARRGCVQNLKHGIRALKKLMSQLILQMSASSVEVAPVLANILRLRFCQVKLCVCVFLFFVFGIF